MSNPDPEIDAMTAIATALEELDTETRARVLTWAWNRFAPEDTTRETAHVGSSETKEVSHDGHEHVFHHFADLFDAVEPTTAAERLLTGCYWLQVVQGNESFASRAVNDLLKDVGHGVHSNVAKTFSGMQKQSPALVRQLSKSGRSQQARKTYKLTIAGINAIRGRF